MPKLLINRELFVVIGIFLLAFLLRLSYHFFLQTNYLFYLHPSTDVRYYQEWAHQIAMGDWVGTKTFFGLPLYPYFLAFIERLSLGNVFVMRLFHFILGSINCVMAYYVANRVFSFRVALLAAILMASNFILIYYDWLMMPVPLIIFLSLFIIFCLSHIDSISSKREWFILGVLSGLLILGDGKILLFWFLCGLYLCFCYKKPVPFKLMNIIIPLLFGIMVILFSVTLRNKIIGGDGVFISAQSGLSFYVGNHDKASGIFENPDFIRPTHQGQDEDQKIVAEAIARRTLSPAEVSQFWKAKALKFIREQPFDYLKLLGKKFKLFFTDTELAHDIDLILQRDWRKKFNFNPYYAICPMALLGIFLALKQGKKSLFLNFIILSQLFMTLIFFLTTRHRTTILPFFIIFESYFIWWFIDQCRTRRIRNILGVFFFFALFFTAFQPKSIDAETLEFTYFAKSGPVYEDQKLYALAQKSYLKALEYRPEDPNTLYNLGNAYYLDHKWEEAEKSYQKAIASCHYHVDALYNLGYLYEEQKKFEKALQQYQSVLEYQPDSFDIQYRMAHIYQHLGDCGRVQESLEILLQMKPVHGRELKQIFSNCR